MSSDGGGTPTQQVAEAIRELIKDWPGVTHPRATAHVLAQAAIDALQLTEECVTEECRCSTVYYAPHKHGIEGCTGKARQGYRFVTPWVEGSTEQ